MHRQYTDKETDGWTNERPFVRRSRRQYHEAFVRRVDPPFCEGGLVLPIVPLPLELVPELPHIPRLRLPHVHGLAYVVRTMVAGGRQWKRNSLSNYAIA